MEESTTTDILSGKPDGVTRLEQSGVGQVFSKSPIDGLFTSRHGPTAFVNGLGSWMQSKAIWKRQNFLCNTP